MPLPSSISLSQNTRSEIAIVSVCARNTGKHDNSCTLAWEREGRPGWVRRKGGCVHSNLISSEQMTVCKSDSDCRAAAAVYYQRIKRSIQSILLTISSSFNQISLLFLEIKEN